MSKIEEKKDILEFIKDNRERLLTFGVKKIGIFGSFVRGEQSKNSDLDILVEFDPEKKNYKNYIKLYNFLEDSLGVSVDMVTSESLSPYIGPHILKEVEYFVLSG